MPNSYEKNDKVRLTANFTVNGVLTDPTTVTLKVKNLSGTISTYTYALAQVTKSAVGIYFKDISLDKIGEWFYRWEGTGAVEAANETYLDVKDSEF